MARRRHRTGCRTHCRKFNRPILIAQDTLGIKPGTGSARTANGLNLHAALTACSEYLVSYGGHAAAAGLRVDDNRLEHFRAAFCEYAASEIPASPPLAELLIDAEGPLNQLRRNLIQQIDQLAPFGSGNPRPVLCATGVQLSEPPKRIGGGERHISMKLVQHRTSIRGVGFGFGDDAEELSKISAPLEHCLPPDQRIQQPAAVEIQLVDWRHQPARQSRPSCSLWAHSVTPQANR
ncbi:MAG: DHHA1 domain-containing protein [Pirellulales bacterium]